MTESRCGKPCDALLEREASLLRLMRAFDEWYRAPQHHRVMDGGDRALILALRKEGEQ